MFCPATSLPLTSVSLLGWVSSAAVGSSLKMLDKIDDIRVVANSPAKCDHHHKELRVEASMADYVKESLNPSFKRSGYFSRREGCVDC